MLFMPINNNVLKETVLVIVIEKSNLERMRDGDPATLEHKERGGIMPTIAYPECTSLVIAYEEDVGPLYEFITNADLLGALRWLERGRKFLPGDGLSTVILRVKNDSRK